MFKLAFHFLKGPRQYLTNSLPLLREPLRGEETEAPTSSGAADGHAAFRTKNGGVATTGWRKDHSAKRQTYGRTRQNV